MNELINNEGSGASAQLQSVEFIDVPPLLHALLFLHRIY
uniref:Uncharacterized protein n=1 Tax=Zea mays TaxID=4577 RepID=C4J7B0_MAIZE|nr:unknown [Zea mays]